MLRRVLNVHSHDRGQSIEGVRRNEALTAVAFLGRRRRVYGRIAALSGAKPGDRVLDIGCGGGYLARLLSTRIGPTGAVTGVDPSAPAIAYAETRAEPNSTFVVGVAQELDFPDAGFDVVTSTLAIHHIPEADRPAAFAEMHRVTRPGGRLAVADFRPSRLHAFGSPEMRHNKVEQLEVLAEAAGFRIESRGDLPLLRWVTAIRPDHPAAR